MKSNIMSEKPISDVECDLQELEEYIEVGRNYLYGLLVIYEIIKENGFKNDKVLSEYRRYILPYKDKFIQICRELNLKLECELGERIPTENLNWTRFIHVKAFRIKYISTVRKIVDGLENLLTKKRKELERLKGQEVRSPLKHTDKKTKEDNIEEIQLSTPIKSNTGQEEISIEEILFYNKKTARFRYRDDESRVLSKTPQHQIRIMAEKLMKWWGNKKACPLREFTKNPLKKIPKRLTNNLVHIRKTLRTDLNINLPRFANDEYLPPDKIKGFKIIEDI